MSYPFIVGRKLNMGKVKLFILMLTTLLGAFSEANSGISYHGRILRPDNSPVNGSNVQFRIQIRTPGTENCLLWEEQQTKNLSTSNGVFSLTISDTNEPSLIANILPYTIEKVFSNRSNFSSLTSCASGTVYNPSPSDGRNLQVFFRENPADPWEQMPVTKINFVPMALNTVQLQGYLPSEFLKISPSSSYTPLTATQVNTLVDLIAGTNTQYLRPSTAFSGDVSGNYNTTSVDKIKGVDVSATAPTNGQVLKLVGGVWTPAADDSGTSPGDASYSAKGLVQINTDLATSGLYINSGVLALPNVITAGGPTGGASSVPVITYDSKGRLTAVSSATVDDTTKLPLAGGTMTGSINMGTQNITNATSIASTNVSTRNVILADNDTDTITIKAPTNVTTTYNFTLPPTGGTSGYVLSTDGSGGTSWVAQATGGLATSDYAADVAPAASCTTTQTPYWDTVADKWACQNIKVTGAGAFIVDGGNTLAATSTIGTNDANALNFETNNTGRMSISSDGRFTFGGTTVGAYFGVDPSPTGTSTYLFQKDSNASGGRMILNDIRSGAGRGFDLLFETQGAINAQLYGGQDASANRYFSIGVGTASTERFRIEDTGYVGIGTTSPSSILDLGGAVTQRGMAAPAVSAAGQGRIYFDSTSNTFKVSQNGGAYSDLVPSTNTYLTQSAYAADVAPAASCTTAQTPYWNTVADTWSCQNIKVTGAGAFFVDGGNSFGAAATIGTNDNFGLNFEANGATQMSILANGNVGIGTVSPTAIFEVKRSIAASGVAGGSISLSAQDTTDTSAGSVSIQGGTRGQGSGASMTLSGGDQWENGGNVTISSGNGNNNAGPGSVTLTTGVTANNGSGIVNITTGSGANHKSGSIYIAPGPTGGNGIGDTYLAITSGGAVRGNVAIGGATPTSILDINGAITQRGMAAPALSPTGQGRIYFDSTSNKFKISQNGGAYVDLFTGGTVDGTGTTNVIPRFTASGTVGDSALSDNGTVITATRAVASTTNPISSGAAINLATSNTHTLASVGGATITVSGMQDGGLYNIVIEDTNPRMYTFSGCTNSYFKPANATTTTGTRSVYGLLTVKKGANWDCYITWSTGFQ